MYLEAVFRFYVLLNHFVGHFFFGLIRFGSFSNTIYRNLALALSKLHINVDITVGFLWDKRTTVSTVALLRPDGTLLLTDGTRYDVSGAFDFETEAARGAYISDRVTSYFAPEKLVVRNVVPVVRDGETVAILYGVVPLQELSRNYQIDPYNGNAFLLLVDGNNGDILLDTRHDSLGNISELRGRKMLKGYTYEEAMEKNPQRHRRRYVHRLPLHGADALPALRAGRHQQLERRARRERGGRRWRARAAWWRRFR